MRMCSIFSLYNKNIYSAVYSQVPAHNRKIQKKWDWNNWVIFRLSQPQLGEIFQQRDLNCKEFSMWNQTPYSPQWDRRCTAKLSSIGFNSGCVFFFWGRTWLATTGQMFRVYPEAVGAFEVRALPKAPSKKAGFGEMSYPPRVVDFSKFFCFFSVL